MSWCHYSFCMLCVLKSISKINNQEIYEYFGKAGALPIPMMNIINGGVHASSGLEIRIYDCSKQSTFKER